MKKQIAAAIVAAQALVLLALPSLAQQTQTTIADTDKQYLTKDAEGSAYEFQLAELGVQKASSRATQQYALRLLDDHAKFNSQLMQLAHKKGITLPLEVNKEMVRINTDDMSDSKQEANMTKDADIQAFLNQFASTDQEHLQGARTLLNGSAANR